MKGVHLKIILAAISCLLCFSAFSADSLVKVGSPAPVPLPGYGHILWQKVAYSQGDCSTELEAIFYWSPASVMVSKSDAFYTPFVQVHGGAWSGSALFNPPSNLVWDDARAARIDETTAKGLIFIHPTYRGQRDIADHPALDNCDHPRELLKDAEFILAAIHNRDPQIPVASEIRPDDKMILFGISAGGHVGAAMMAKHPDWIERAVLASGIYDMQDWRANWDAHWSDFGDRNLAECTQEYGNTWTARTLHPALWNLTTANANCTKIPDSDSDLDLPYTRAYLITDMDDGDWVEVSDGYFSQLAVDLGIWGTLNYDKFHVNGSIVASSSGGSLPTMVDVKIEEVVPGSVPLKTAAGAKDLIIAANAAGTAKALSAYLNEPFLGLSADDPILVENSFGKTITANGGQYPPFLLGTNSGDFSIQEQALAFCNDIQDVDSLPHNSALTSHAKGTYYQCGDRGTLFVTVGGDHFTSTTHGEAQVPALFDWLFNDWEASHSAKANAETCYYNFDGTQATLIDWITDAPGVDFFAYWSGVLLGQSKYDSNLYYSDWDAIQNDPKYFGKSTDSIPIVLQYGLSRLFVVSRGLLEVDAGGYGKHHKICFRALL